MKELRLRPRAEADLIDRTQYHVAEGGRTRGERFFDQAIAVLDAVSEMPGIGSPGVGELAEVPGLRRVSVEGFACGWYYLERETFIEVIRLLADRQDLIRLLTD
ncbi:MAG TPA: type II toxin-antitoxin system RelE/ParE family toxin [Acidimicrobiales bacterium]|nr:type II toxin-antitoxin system RelE/ParE family toxin [Acidimicrobiales bacterium]